MVSQVQEALFFPFSLLGVWCEHLGGDAGGGTFAEYQYVWIGGAFLPWREGVACRLDRSPCFTEGQRGPASPLLYPGLSPCDHFGAKLQEDGSWSFRGWKLVEWWRMSSRGMRERIA